MKREIKKGDSVLKMLRKSKGMLDREVAEKMGVTRHIVSHWENGHVLTITEEQAKKYAEVLDVPVELIAHELKIRSGAKTPKTENLWLTDEEKNRQMTVEDVLRNTAPEDADPDFMKELKDGLKVAAVPSSVRCADTSRLRARSRFGSECPPDIHSLPNRASRPSGKARENGWRKADEEKPHGKCVVVTKSGRVSYLREEDEILFWIPVPEVPHEN